MRRRTIRLFRALWTQLGLPLVAVALATAVTVVVRDFAENALYLPFTAAVAIATWRGGRAAAVTTIVASVLAVDLVFIGPRGDLRILTLGPAIRLISFLIVAATIAAMTNALSQARDQAVELRRAAEAANAAKSAFLSMMSHELRTPIGALIGYVDLMDAGIGGPVTEEQRRYLLHVRSAARHLLNLVNDVLDLARAEAGHIHLRTVDGLMSGVVEEALAVVLPLASEKEVALTRHGSPSVAFRADEDRVRQILINLLGNAIKFTPHGGRVSIAWGYGAAGNDGGAGQSGENRAWAAVSDSGVGIDPADHQRIFEAFERVETRPANRQPGTGLGLAISRRLAREMKGDLDVRSAPGAGSTFTLVVPQGDESRAARSAQRVQAVRTDI